MKTVISLSKMLLLGTFLINVLAVSAVSPRNYMYDTKEENGQVVSKTIFLNDNGLLNKQFMYEFTYNEEGKVAEKTAYKWDKRKEKWEPYYFISYQYDSNNEEIHSIYGMWDSKKKDYSLNVQTINIPLSSYEEIFS